MNAVLKIEHLNKSFGSRKILQDISFETYEGEIFGFLGPNGAGKTTTIKIAVGMLSLDEGNITIGGYDLRKNYESAMANIGGIVENPEFYKYLSGLDNLRQYARMRDGITEERIREVIHLVGLDKRINDKVGKYSLGMRQRLGVAQAIMHHPKVLILDEPTNGLDPAGIKELRDILKRLAHEEKVGVLVSSHLMSEMELMCDRVGVIVNGVLIDEKPIDELIAAAAPDKTNYVYSVSNPDALIEKLDFVASENITKNEDGTIDIILSKVDAISVLSRINKLVIESGIELYTVSPKENKKLEDVFIAITNTSGGVQID